MAAAIGNVDSAIAHRFGVVVVSKRTADLGVSSTFAHSTIIYAGKIGLARDTGAKPHIQGLIPDIQLPNVGRIARGNEVLRAGMCYNHYGFIGSDAVEAGHDQVRQSIRLYVKTPS